MILSDLHPLPIDGPFCPLAAGTYVLASFRIIPAMLGCLVAQCYDCLFSTRLPFD